MKDFNTFISEFKGEENGLKKTTHIFYHGSPYKFDRITSHNIGSHGGLKFGWGFYLTKNFDHAALYSGNVYCTFIKYDIYIDGKFVCNIHNSIKGLENLEVYHNAINYSSNINALIFSKKNIKSYLLEIIDLFSKEDSTSTYFWQSLETQVIQSNNVQLKYPTEIRALTGNIFSNKMFRTQYNGVYEVKFDGVMVYESDKIIGAYYHFINQQLRIENINIGNVKGKTFHYLREQLKKHFNDDKKVSLFMHRCHINGLVVDVSTGDIDTNYLCWSSNCLTIKKLYKL